jgi:hypothetical protein
MGRRARARQAKTRGGDPRVIRAMAAHGLPRIHRVWESRPRDRHSGRVWECG